MDAAGCVVGTGGVTCRCFLQCGEGDGRPLAISRTYAVARRVQVCVMRSRFRLRGLSKDGYIVGHRRRLEHRRIAERVLGRPLTKDECVHHIDENPANNAPDNLIILSRSYHAWLHRQMWKVHEMKRLRWERDQEIRRLQWARDQHIAQLFRRSANPPMQSRMECPTTLTLED
jgi:hypothetical protein